MAGDNISWAGNAWDLFFGKVNKMDKIATPTTNGILVQDSSGNASDSGVLIGNVALSSQIPTKTSDLTNDSRFVVDGTTPKEYFDYTISSNVVTINGRNTQYGDYYMYSEIIIPNKIEGKKVTAINAQAFYDSDIRSIVNKFVLPDTLITIGDSAFRDVTGITSVVIPDKVTTITMRAFTGCTALTSVAIGRGVTTIGDNAFEGCSALTDIYYNGTKEQWDLINISNVSVSGVGLLDKIANGTIKVHYNYVDGTTYVDSTDLSDMLEEVFG